MWVLTAGLAVSDLKKIEMITFSQEKNKNYPTSKHKHKYVFVFHYEKLLLAWMDYEKMSPWQHS